jgi:hypothetical protein
LISGFLESLKIPSLDGDFVIQAYNIIHDFNTGLQYTLMGKPLSIALKGQ